LLPSVSTLSPCRLLPNTDPRLRPVRKWWYVSVISQPSFFQYGSISVFITMK
jgi:hypothetical protein